MPVRNYISVASYNRAAALPKVCPHAYNRAKYVIDNCRKICAFYLNIFELAFELIKLYAALLFNLLNKSGKCADFFLVLDFKAVNTCAQNAYPRGYVHLSSVYSV